MHSLTGRSSLGDQGGKEEAMEFIRKKGMEAMEVVERGGVPFLVFPKLSAAEGVVHGFSTRQGGVSRGIFWVLTAGGWCFRIRLILPISAW